MWTLEKFWVARKGEVKVETEFWSISKIPIEHEKEIEVDNQEIFETALKLY